MIHTVRRPAGADDLIQLQPAWQQLVADVVEKRAAITRLRRHQECRAFRGFRRELVRGAGPLVQPVENAVHRFSASAISGFNKKLDEELGRFARRELDCEYPYLILDARYEKVRENAVIRSRAVLVAIGIDWDGRRQVLGVEMANRESSTSWKDFLLGS